MWIWQPKNRLAPGPVTKVKESSHGTPSQNEPTDSQISGFFEKF